MVLTKWTAFTLTHSTEGDPKIRRGLKAEISDPLFFLARQWQLGEFYGEDAGSPILVNVESEAFPITHLYHGNQRLPYQSQDLPLEVAVEREVPRQVEPDIRTRAQAGLLLLQRIEQAGLSLDRDYVSRQFQFVNDQESDQDQLESICLQLLKQRSPDGQRLYSELTDNAMSDSRLSELFPSANTDSYPTYRQIIQTWRQDYEQQIGNSNREETWLEERMEYQFRVAVPTDMGEVELAADEYLGGQLDWDAFEIHRIDSSQTSATSILQRETLLPTAITYAGMPAQRWWEFEDGRVDFGNPDGVDRDIGRLLLAEFAMSWGNDWFQIPVTVPFGCLCRINELRVTDTFGGTTRISAQIENSPGWAMNVLSQSSNQIYNSDLNRFLWVPPSLPIALQAQPLEEVLFLRDEIANLAWAIEKILPDPLGRPQETSFSESFHYSPSGQADEGEPRYEVITDLPEWWIPLVPVADTTQNCHFLVKAGLHDSVDQNPPESQGALLSTQSFRVYDEEIPREGVSVSRAYQLTRWYEGRRMLWVGRRKHPGAGEIRSHLEFDRLLNFGKQLPIPLFISQINPSLGQRGQSEIVTISGRGLIDVQEIEFAGTGISTHIRRGGNSFFMTVDLSIDATAALGEHSFQIRTPDGIVDSEEFGIRFRVSAPVTYEDNGYLSNFGIGGNLL